MKRLKILIMLLTVACAGLYVCGCGRAKEAAGDNRVIARINKYTMTAEDFRNSASRTFGATKEEILDELITKNVLIQEAQKENFDKDKAFMKEIERYWEQALLKLLIKKKTAEFSIAFGGDKEKVGAAMERWIKDLRARTNVKIDKKNLDEISIPDTKGGNDGQR